MWWESQCVNFYLEVKANDRFNLINDLSEEIWRNYKTNRDLLAKNFLFI